MIKLSNYYGKGLTQNMKYEYLTIDRSYIIVLKLPKYMINTYFLLNSLYPFLSCNTLSLPFVMALRER